MARKRSSFLDLILDRVEFAAEELVDDLLYDLKQELPRIQAQAGMQNTPPTPDAESGRRKQRKNKGQTHNTAPQTAPTAQSGLTAYDDLEVSPRASHETIEAAFKSLAKRYHPDVSKHKEAGERMRQINAAWERIGDPEKRKKYDKSIGL